MLPGHRPALPEARRLSLALLRSASRPPRRRPWSPCGPSSAPDARWPAPALPCSVAPAGVAGL
ncbi:MAG: hypothetical protein M0C28_48995 [Candidatus Moduliflexus flocculans]|nr:hypothetical protein [Candidatus Moduliflexus flocculans]